MGAVGHVANQTCAHRKHQDVGRADPEKNFIQFWSAVAQKIRHAHTASIKMYAGLTLNFFFLQFWSAVAQKIRRAHTASMKM